ncbi:hypothetical protein ACVNS2_16705 [Paenibacillus caseinilyticus]|uniref:Uncharacterized protein n=1 Tax=Paenibacillus mucilaginosus K02 TaxID=997761 RepID=R9UPV4_9BACL|nr:hypothetical protein [Paenibacillus mucilaginosus]AGN70685.1 hypothetical protein B2K_39365 [Paenibacillus mucilaginosus K02]
MRLQFCLGLAFGRVNLCIPKLGESGFKLTSEEIKASIQKAWLDHNAKVQPAKLTDSGTSSEQKVI